MAETLLVGTTKGAFAFDRDASGGEWTARGPFLLGWSVDSVVGLPRADGASSLMVGTSHLAYGPSVRRSEDGGETWTQQLESPRHAKERCRLIRRVWTIVPATGDPHGETLYAGVEDAALFCSDDRGRTWRELEGLSRHAGRSGWRPAHGHLAVHSVLPDSRDARRMWVGVQGGGVLRSEDGGETWHACAPVPIATEAGDGARCTHRLAADPTRPGTLYLQHHLGLFRSADGGDSWTAIGRDLPGGGFGFPLCVAPNGDVFVAPLASADERYMPAGRLALYRSRDRGETWEELRRGLPAAPQFVGVLRGALTSGRGRPYAVAFGTTAGQLFYSPDGGFTWEQLPGQYGRVTTLAFARDGATL